MVVLQGARQVGKSTVARLLAERMGGTLVDLDDPLALDGMVMDARGALEGAAAPVVVDEFQRAGPAFVAAVKTIVDRDRRAGQFLLAGSANYLAARHHVETLAGRNVKLVLWPLSQGELTGTRERFLELATGQGSELLDLSPPKLSSRELAERICLGGYPEIALGRIGAAHRRRWFASYGADCTEREALRGIAEVRKTDELRRTLGALALRTGGELVLQHLRRDLGDAGSALDHKTLVAFVDLLDGLHLVHRVPAWSSNATVAARKHPKVHLADTGLAAALGGVGPESLTDGSVPGPFWGQLVETFVVNELAKQSSFLADPVTLRHYRDSDHEVDLIVEQADGSFVGVEVKAGAARPGDSRHLAWLRDRHPDRFRAGIVLHGGSTRAALGDRLFAVPIATLWA